MSYKKRIGGKAEAVSVPTKHSTRNMEGFFWGPCWLKARAHFQKKGHYQSWVPINSTTDTRKKRINKRIGSKITFSILIHHYWCAMRTLGEVNFSSNQSHLNGFFKSHQRDRFWTVQSHGSWSIGASKKIRIINWTLSVYFEYPLYLTVR